MWRVIRWSAFAVVALVVIAGLLWTASRLSGPTDAQREAIALLERPSAPVGDDAFAALWLLPYDVPMAELESVARADTARLAAQPHLRVAPGAWAPEAYRAFTTSAKGRYQNLEPSAQDIELMYKARESGCLARVRSDVQAYTALAERNARLFDRIAALSTYDFIRSPILDRIDVPLPGYVSGGRATTGHAVAFVTGDKSAALEATCRDMTTWRRLGNHSDTLIARMIGIAFSTDANGRLLADMLAELPRDAAIPGTCTKALVPMPPSETLLCNAMRGEFQFSNASIRAMAPDPKQGAAAFALQQATMGLLFDPEKMRASTAVRFAAFCSDDALSRIAADLPPEHREPDSLARLDCVANAIGCILSDMAGPAYTEYAARAQDQAARIQLLGTLLWLREQPDDGRSLAQKIASRPASLVSPTRPVEVTDDGSAIRIRQFDTARGDTWQVPLPAFLRNANAGSALTPAPVAPRE